MSSSWLRSEDVNVFTGIIRLAGKWRQTTSSPWRTSAIITRSFQRTTSRWQSTASWSTTVGASRHRGRHISSWSSARLGQRPVLGGRCRKRDQSGVHWDCTRSLLTAAERNGASHRCGLCWLLFLFRKHVNRRIAVSSEHSDPVTGCQAASWQERVRDRALPCYLTAPCSSNFQPPGGWLAPPPR